MNEFLGKFLFYFNDEQVVYAILCIVRNGCRVIIHPSTQERTTGIEKWDCDWKGYEIKFNAYSELRVKHCNDQDV